MFMSVILILILMHPTPEGRQGRLSAVKPEHRTDMATRLVTMGGIKAETLVTKMPARGIRARVQAYPTARQPHRVKKEQRMSINARDVIQVGI